MKDDSIKCLKGVGDKTEKLFRRINVLTVSDLLAYYPRGYDLYEAPLTAAAVRPETKAAVQGRVLQHVEVKQVRNLNILTTRIGDEHGQLYATWFNMPFLKSTLVKGTVLIFRGRIVNKNGRITMEQPKLFTAAAYDRLQSSLQPIYTLTAGLSNKLVSKSVLQLMDKTELFAEYLPESLRRRYELAEYQYALKNIHFPEHYEALKRARKRLVFDEFLLFILALSKIKAKSNKAVNNAPMKAVWETEAVIERLPYKMTNAQTQVWHEIERDMQGHILMTRLVQGDVGSGKTIIAFLTMIMTAENNYQSALMVPTEVLARQHYEALLQLLTDAEWERYQPLLLTGSNTAKEKRERYQAIQSGACKMIIGTHALIQEKVQYHNLGLVITDEQHRFGVCQRETLSSKGSDPHILVMSATPIPRTLAIILYGDLDISIIDELPAKRLPIKNCVVNQTYRPTAYRFIKNELKNGRQAYVICPLVEESEGLEAENVIDYCARLRSVFAAEITVEYLHGRMKADQKNQLMERFAKNEIHILVSTTVIEVGINVPNATVMMVENAERFGLAQLHQLRGRVGRGSFQSYCIFVQGDQSDATSKRLDILNKSNDGFYIAGEDLKLRGPGDLIGIRQSGNIEFAIADIFQDADILKLTSEAAGEIIAQDEYLELEQHILLREKLTRYMRQQTDRIGL